MEIFFKGFTFTMFVLEFEMQFYPIGIYMKRNWNRNCCDEVRLSVLRWLTMNCLKRTNYLCFMIIVPIKGVPYLL